MQLLRSPPQCQLVSRQARCLHLARPPAGCGAAAVCSERVGARLVTRALEPAALLANKRPYGGQIEDTQTQSGCRSSRHWLPGDVPAYLGWSDLPRAKPRLEVCLSQRSNLYRSDASFCEHKLVGPVCHQSDKGHARILFIDAQHLPSTQTSEDNLT